LIILTTPASFSILSEIAAVRRLDLRDGSHYELTGDHHHHLICESCGGVSEVERSPLDLRHQRGVDFEISSHTLEIYGRCADCR
jgi:Fur family transcriptional regulator, ferric uptake regulator